MLNLLDYIQNDLPTIESYIGKYGTFLANYVGSEEYFKYWAESNKKLFHLLGGNLILEKEVSIKKDDEAVSRDINNFMDKYGFFKKALINAIWDNYESNAIEDSDNYWKLRDSLSGLFMKDALKTNATIFELYFYNKKTDKKLRLNKGTKTMKSIKKVIDFFELGNEPIRKEDSHDRVYETKIPTFNEAFEEFRLDHSQVLNDTDLHGILCLSIHPLDFLTMSDNNSGWSSCMSWMENGCYHAGTVEMMNSNNVICVYLKSKDDDSFKWEYKGEHSWNNKKWRQLFYVTKEIIVSGKAYPYQSKDITFVALEWLRDLAKENWNHTYEYGIERYKDMIHIDTIFKMANHRRWIQTKQTKKKNILFHSKGMYNDMFNDNNLPYYCVRNKVKKNTIITYSGKCPCLGCGKEFLQKEYDIEDSLYSDYSSEYYYNDRYSNTSSVLCEDCYGKFKCDYCDEPYARDLFKLPNGKIVCKYCLRDSLIHCPCCGKITYYRSYIAPDAIDHKSTIVVAVEDPNLNFKDNYIKFCTEYGYTGRTYNYFNDWLYAFKESHLVNVCEDCLRKIIRQEDNDDNVEDLSRNQWSREPIKLLRIGFDDLEKYILPEYKVENCFEAGYVQVTESEFGDLESLRIY